MVILPELNEVKDSKEVYVNFNDPNMSGLTITGEIEGLANDVGVMTITTKTMKAVIDATKVLCVTFYK